MSLEETQENFLETLHDSFKELVDNKQFLQAGQIVRSMRSAGFATEADELQEDLIKAVEKHGQNS